MSENSHKRVVNLVVSMVICVVIMLALLMPGWILPHTSSADDETTTASTTTDTGETSSATDSSSEESSSAAENSGSDVAATGTAQTADEIEGSVTCMGGDVVVSMASMDAEAKTISIRVDNNLDVDISPQGLPKQTLDGESSNIPYPSNQKVSQGTVIPAGQYMILTYNVKDVTFTATEAVYEGQFTSSSDLTDKSYTLTVNVADFQ